MKKPKLLARFAVLCATAVVSSLVASLNAQRNEVETPATAEDALSLARFAVLEGRLGDAEMVLIERLPAAMPATRQSEQLADQLGLLALTVINDRKYAEARTLVDMARAWYRPPAVVPQGRTGQEIAGQWYQEGMVQWHVLGDLAQAREALARAFALDPKGQAEAALLLDHLEAVELEAAIKGEALNRQQEELP